MLVGDRSMHLLGLQQALPGTGYRSLTACPCSVRSRTPMSWPGWTRRGLPPTRRTARSSRCRSRAQQAAFEAVRPGVPCQAIDRVARRVITKAGYATNSSTAPAMGSA